MNVLLILPGCTNDFAGQYLNERVREVMFLFRRKNKNRPIPPPVSPPIPKEFIYYLREDPGSDGILLTLSHSLSRPENADSDDFTAISREILEGVFSGFWVSAWVWDRVPCYFILPDGQRCKEKRIFSQAFQQYAKHSGLPHPVLVNDDGRIALFSQGFFSPFFSSYMSDMSDMLDVLEDYFDREMYFYGYKQPFEASKCYDEEERRVESKSWDIQAFFDELHDNLVLFIKDPYEITRITSLAQRACNKYRKEFRTIPKTSDSP